MRKPPQLARIFAEHSFPPSYRVQVLGDIEERFRQAPPRHAARRYCLDIVTAVASVLWCPRNSTRLTHSDLRQRAEAFQDSVWRRSIFHVLVVSVFMVFQFTKALQTTAIYPRALRGIAVVAIVFWIRNLWTRRAPRPVPSALSEIELRQFHRAELIRHRDFALRSSRELMGSYALWLALWLPVYATTIRNLPDFLWGLLVFPSALMLAFLIPRVRHDIAAHVQRLQHEIDSLAYNDRT